VRYVRMTHLHLLGHRVEGPRLIAPAN
jgi:hypothetical protein